MIATRNPLIRLNHIRKEIDEIGALLTGVSRDRYLSEYLLRRATERALLIISEAARALPADLLSRYPEVNWSEVIGLGNILRHDYHMVDDDTVWEIMLRDIPELSPVIDRMIADLGG